MKNTGGAAFPIEGFNGWGEPELGMTLRDYFAAKAMHRYMDNEVWHTNTYKAAAESSYALADAMLKAREA
jgi:lysozyme family protein